MNQKIDISVIIPTYNRGWVLAEAIDSVLKQKHANFELIIVDDGSTDDTEEILKRYAGQIRIIRQENKGVSAARNIGIAASRASLVALLDSDDLWLPEKLQRQARFFQDRPDALICQTQEIWIRNGKRVNPKNRHEKLSGDIFLSSLSLCLVSPSAVMFKKELLEDIGLFDETLPACEDYDMWLRVSRKFPVYLIDDPLVIKRGGHEDQLSRMPGLDRFRITSIKKLLDRDELTDTQRLAAAAKLKEKCAIYGTGCLKRGRLDEARYYFSLAESI